MIKAKLAAQVARLAADRVPFVLATVVRARRPTSVRPGDTAIVLADGTIDGFVGGQCAQSSVRLYSLRGLETGEPMLLRLIPSDLADDELSDGIDGAVVERNPCLSGGALEIFLEPQLPAPRLVVVGGSPIARALVEIAAAAGYATEATDGEEFGELTGASAVVVASHGSSEEAVLAGALAAGVPYVGLVASQTRGAAVREALALPPEINLQLHTPAGVDIGAQTPAEIAIAILAEMIVIAHADPVPERPMNTAVTAPAREVDSGDDGGGGEQVQAVASGSEDAVASDEPGGANGDREHPINSLIPKLPGVQTKDWHPVSGASLERRIGSDALQSRVNGEGRQQFVASHDRDRDSVDSATDQGAPDASAESASEESGVSAVATAVDPVCGMKVAINDKTLNLKVSGSTVYFCGTGCRVAYAAQYAVDGAAG